MLIIDFKDILATPKRIDDIVCSELDEVSKKFGTNRKTEISLESVESSTFDAQDLIADEEVVVQLSQDQFIKRLPLDTFKRQKRGGKGVQGAGGTTKRDDIIKIIRIVSTHDTIMFFSNKGRAFIMKVFELPVATKEARGKSLKAILNLNQDEIISSFCTFREFNDDSLLMVTRKGIIKKCALKEFSNTKKSGIIALGLREDDGLIDVKLIKPEEDVVLASKTGLALRTNLAKLRSQRRTATGVTGMRLAKDDILVGVTIVDPKSDLLVITENGYGKRMDYSEFSAKGRGGRGMTYLKITEKNGPAIGVISVNSQDEVIVIAVSGMVIRVNASEISKVGRATVGVRVVNIKEEDKAQDFAIISEREDE